MTAPLLLSLLALITFGSSESIPDWLTTDSGIATRLEKTEQGTLHLSNGIIHREFLLYPDFATIEFYSHERQSSLIRAMTPEAQITLDNRQYNISGILTGIPRGYLNKTALFQDMRANPDAFHFYGYKTSQPEPPFKYTPGRGAPKDLSWPPKGLRLDVMFKAPFNAFADHQGVTVIVHYEMYDGIPLMSKWLTVQGPDHVHLSFDRVEHLAVNWPWAQQGYGWLDIRTDQSHNAEALWGLDPLHADMPGSFQAEVHCQYHTSPKLPLSEMSESFRVHELLHASSDPERVGLAQRQRFRLLAPQTQENPIFFHMTTSETKAVRNLIDQMAEVGFEMLIFSFKSGFDFESTNETYIEQLAADVAYAKSKGIEVGGHDLIVWTKVVPDEWAADTHTSYRGACMASGWYDYLLNQYRMIIKRTGMSMVEADGPYPGYGCHSSNHSHHRSYQDSVYKQQLLQGKFFQTLHEEGIYINQPDSFFFQGANKAVMGYKESQYALPRWQDLSISRQGMFDDTFEYTPTIGWMILPLIDYKTSGGAAGMFEPLASNLKAYEWGLAQYFGAGVAACYRGYRLYDTPETKAVVAKWVSFYKQHRDILSSDIIHVRRADMQSLDCYMHVNYRLEHKALAMVFNPTLEALQMNLTLPLYYSGLSAKALVSQEGGPFTAYPMDRQFNIEVPVALKALGITWFVIKE